MSITIHTMKYVKFSDIAQTFNKTLNDYIFTEQVIDGSDFINFEIDDYRLEEVAAEIEWNRNKFNDDEMKRWENEEELIKYFRSLGYRDCIVVYINC